MQTVTSKDGTSIAYEKVGQGPALIMVVGAFNDRTKGAPLAEALKAHFTIYLYDRRGRGDSGDTLPYAVEREIEDLDALIQAAGGSAFVFGYSSGAVLTLRAAAHGLAINKIALYDPPPTGTKPGELATQLTELVASGRQGEAVELFQLEGVGLPRELVVSLRNAPFRPALEATAHTLVYEMSILSDEAMPPAFAASVRTTTLIMVGDKNPQVLLDSSQGYAGVIADAQYRALEGQTHDIEPAAIAPVMQTFLSP